MLTEVAKLCYKSVSHNNNLHGKNMKLPTKNKYCNIDQKKCPFIQNVFDIAGVAKR